MNITPRDKYSCEKFNEYRYDGIVFENHLTKDDDGKPVIEHIIIDVIDVDIHWLVIFDTYLLIRFVDPQHPYDVHAYFRDIDPQLKPKHVHFVKPYDKLSKLEDVVSASLLGKSQMIFMTNVFKFKTMYDPAEHIKNHDIPKIFENPKSVEYLPGKNTDDDEFMWTVETQESVPFTPTRALILKYIEGAEVFKTKMTRQKRPQSKLFTFKTKWDPEEYIKSRLLPQVFSDIHEIVCIPTSNTEDEEHFWTITLEKPKSIDYTNNKILKVMPEATVVKCDVKNYGIA